MGLEKDRLQDEVPQIMRSADLSCSLPSEFQGGGWEA